VFDDEELETLRGQDQLFPVASARRKKGPRTQGGGAGGAGKAGRAGEVLAQAASPALLDPEQQAIVAAAPARALVFAGPGTGKTRLLTAWIAGKAAGSAAPAGILALTFTNKAAAELRERLEALSPADAQRISCDTFHSFSWSVLREHDASLLSIIAPADRAEMLAPLVPGASRTQVSALGERMERCWEGMEEPDETLRALMQDYQDELRRMGFADVSSLVSGTLALLRSDEPLLARMRARFSTIAVDELQDINRPQYELLMLLCESAQAVLCIGDPDQAIYGFRGSDRELFFRFLEQTGARSFSLNRNYRSTGAVVDAANALISAERTPGVPPLAPVREQGPAVRAFLADDPGAEGRFIASAIRDLVGGVDAVSVDAARARGAGSHAFSDIAVLFRTRAVRDALLPALVDAGLPLSFGTARPLSEEEPLRSLIAALRCVLNPRDPVSLRVLAAHQAENGLGDTLPAFLQRCPELAAVASQNGIPALIAELVGGVVRIDRSNPDAAVGEELIRESAGEHRGSLGEFLTRVSLCARESEGPRSAQRISLLTFHAAKGLEFPVVFIAGAEEGITPLPENIPEERRLFYVAVTRAREMLYITRCRRRRVHGEMQERAASRWLSEVPRLQSGEASPRHARGAAQLTLFG
jgi:superfamily I DNA/RNA helicase